MAIWHLRDTFPEVEFIGLEPAVKPAVERTSSGKVGVLATPRTVAGGRGWYTVAIYAPDGTRVASVAQEQLFAARRVR